MQQRCLAREMQTLAYLVALLLATCLWGCEKAEPLKPLQLHCYAALYSKGIYESENGGVSWSPLGTEEKELSFYFKRLFQDPSNKDHLYIGTTGAGLFKFNLHEKSLHKMDSFAERVVLSAVFPEPQFSPERKNPMFVATHGEGIFVSSDDHTRWQAFNSGLYCREVNVLYTGGKSLFAGTERELFKWNSSSGKWEAQSDGIMNKNIVAMAGDKQEAFILAGAGAFNYEKGFFSSIPCLYKSSDRGKTWVASDKGLPNGTLVYSIAVNPEKPNRIYLGTSEGVFRSTNSGEKWEKTNEALPKRVRVLEIQFARTAKGDHLVYAAAGPHGVFRAPDAEEVLWSNLSYDIGFSSITGIALSDN